MIRLASPHIDIVCFTFTLNIHNFALYTNALNAHSTPDVQMHMDVHAPAPNGVNAVSSSPADAPNGMAVDADEDDSGSLRELHNDLESSIARHQASPSKQAGAAAQGSFARPLLP